MVLPAPPAPLPVATSSHLRPLPFGEIPRAEWQRLFLATPAATPFSSWTFQRAWWDAYAATADDHYLVWGDGDEQREGEPGARDLTEARPPALRAIVPLMLRRIPARESLVTTAYFGATYHADYATVLVARSDIVIVAELLAGHVVGLIERGTVERADLRRLAVDDPLTGPLVQAMTRRAAEVGVRCVTTQEDVCPALSLPGEWTDLLASMTRKARHEVRRKVRRAERAGPLSLRYLPLDQASAERFMELHQARWGSTGLYPDDADGQRSRTFLSRLVELEAGAHGDAGLHLAEVLAAERPIYRLVGFGSRGTCYFFNAGLDPAYLDLSPGVVGTATYLADRIARGDERFDFLRGNEPYKYEWGAADRALTRIVIGPRAGA